MVRAFCILSVLFLIAPFSLSAGTISTRSDLAEKDDEGSYFYVTIWMKYTDTVSADTKHFYLDISFPEDPSVSIDS